MTTATEARLDLPIIPPSPHTIWKHHKGTHYIVVMIVIIEATLEQAVVYKRLAGDDYRNWCRPMSEFMDGRFKQIKHTTE